MNVALLADTAWLDEEIASLQHLVVGLIDEQVRVAQVVPRDLPMPDGGLYGERVAYDESRWGELTRWRVLKLQESLQRFDPDLVHCLSSRLWRAAVDLADELSVPVILAADGARAVTEAERLQRGTDLSRVAFAASTEPVVRALRQRLPEEVPVERIPPGVHATERNRGCRDDESLCGIISGDGRLDDHYGVLLDVLHEFCREYPQAQFFFESRGSDQHDLWCTARKLGLLPNVSLIPRRLGHRELLLRADVLLHPQPLGQARSMTLQAMAHTLAVVAHEDPWLDYLHDDETAWVLHDPDDAAWRNRLEQLISEPQRGNELGERARQWIREGHLVSDQIERVLDLYRRVTGQTIPFPGAVAGRE